jgi:hypothetical protein
MRLRLYPGQKKVFTPLDHLELLYKPASIVAGRSRGRLDGRLVVVSNRVPLPACLATPAAGGLAVALEAALKARGGLWFGWSGEACKESEPVPKFSTKGPITFAVSALSRRDIEQYYHGFANRVLWPVCHYRLDLADLSEPDKIVKMQIAPIRLPGRNRQGLPQVPPRICCLKVTKRNAVS